jgi:hypothetical protein
MQMLPRAARTPNVANDPAKPDAQKPDLPMEPVELLGMSIASRHHSRALGDAQVGLPQPNPMLPGKSRQPFDRCVQQFRICWESNVLGLHRCIDANPRQIHRSAPLSCATRKLSATRSSSLALAPMAQVRALVRKLMVEEFLAGELLEIRVIDPVDWPCRIGPCFRIGAPPSPLSSNCSSTSYRYARQRHNRSEATVQVPAGIGAPTLQPPPVE